MAAPWLRALLGRAALPVAVRVPAVPLAVVPGRGYRAPPPRRSPPGPFRPDPADPRAPRWLLGARGASRRFGRFGAASGEDPARLWPSPERLRELQDEERPLRELLEAAERKERQERERQEERARRVALALARMPALVAAWREARAAARGGAARGGAPGDAERRRDEKRRRRQQRRDEALRALAAAKEAAAAAPPPPGVHATPPAAP